MEAQKKAIVEETKALNQEIKVPLIELARNNTGVYDREAMKAILASVPWTRFSIPVYSYRNLVIAGQGDKHGHVVIGFVTNYDAVTEEFTISVYGRIAEAVKAFKDAIVYPRVITTQKKELIVTALDVTPKGIHSKLFRMEKGENTNHSKGDFKQRGNGVRKDNAGKGNRR